MKIATRIGLVAVIGVILGYAIAGGADRATVNARVHGRRLDFLVDNQTVATCSTDPAGPRPFLWPLLGPGGVPLTRGWPMAKAPPGGSVDHPHHRSAWFCHGDVIPDGMTIKERVPGVKGIDFWSEHKGHGRIVCTRLGEPRAGPDSVSVETHNQWQTADGVTVLEESRVITLHQWGDARLFVFDIDLVADRAPVTFGDTKEGSFAVRVNDALRAWKGTGRITNADGKTGEGACWGRLSAWCDYSGTIDGHAVGIAIFDDPANRYPACWHCRAYGLMAANPFGRAKSGFPAMRGRTDLVKLARSEHLRLRYGLFAHAGDAVEGKVAEHFQRFVKLNDRPGDRR